MRYTNHMEYCIVAMVVGVAEPKSTNTESCSGCTMVASASDNGQY